MRHPLTFSLNGRLVEAVIAPHATLLEVLREDLGLPGTKHGCELGECGACTVLLDGEPTLSCLVLAPETEGRVVRTIEGLAEGRRLDPLQSLFAVHSGSQCGYCSAGMLLTARALLDRLPEASPAQVREALSGNICRCTGYEAIVDAVLAAAAQERAERAP